MTLIEILRTHNPEIYQDCHVAADLLEEICEFLKMVVNDDGYTDEGTIDDLIKKIGL